MALQAALEYAIHGFAPTAVVNVEEIDGRVTGTVIASEFENVSAPDRQRHVWKRIRDEMGPNSAKVGALLLYTPEEAEAAAKE
jgi:acid stress-induced BolA-like protein IbaG/YrbA